MKQKTPRAPSAFTLIEMFVVIALLMVLATMLLPTLRRPKVPSSRISCLNNLKEVGVAYRLWAGDNGDLFPFQQSVSKGGWKEFLTNANQGAICWTNYLIMQDDFGQSPRILICPNDQRLPATNLAADLNNTHVSYFVGVSASDLYPQFDPRG